MGKIKLFPTAEYSSKQPLDPVVPLVPCTGIFLGPSKSGKTVAQQYRGVFEKIYIFSPSIGIDDGWIPVKKYIEEDLGVNTERERAYYDEWDEAALRDIIQRQRKITETSKKLEMKKLYQVLIICDDFADSPQLHKPHGALDTLFIRGRHLQISTWVSSQKLRLISAAVRVNMQFLCCWRLRNQHELEAVIEEQATLQLPLRLLSEAKESNVPHALRRAFCTGKRSRWERRSASWARSCSLALPLGKPVLIGRAIKRGWGEPSNEVGRASTKGPLGEPLNHFHSGFEETETESQTEVT